MKSRLHDIKATRAGSGGHVLLEICSSLRLLKKMDDILNTEIEDSQFFGKQFGTGPEDGWL